MRRANESDVLKLAGQMDAAASSLRKSTNCQCVTRKLDDDGLLVETVGCKTKLEHAQRVARQAAGFEKSSDSSNRGGDTPNPTLAAVVGMAKQDGTWKPHMGPDWWHHRLLLCTQIMNAALGELLTLVGDLGKVTTTMPKDLTKNGQGTCPACDTFCSGAVNDRLIAGLCDTDYRAWKRAGCPERFRWVQHRRGELAS